MTPKLSSEVKKVICGFAGIGKSTCAKELLGVVDLESTPFNKDWEVYARCAKHMADNGYTVLLSCHKELRQHLLDNGVEFTTVIPSPILREGSHSIDSKTVYLKRYKDRGNTQDFIKLMSNNWGEFNTVLPNEEVIELPLDKYLIDIL